MNLIKLLTAESQSNNKIFNLIVNFYSIIPQTEWLKEYIFWELELLKVLGYDLEFKQLVSKLIKDDKILYVVESSKEKKVVPNFLVDKSKSVNDLKTLLNGLKLVGDYMDKTILKPNNINFPIIRNQFVNSLKH
jgi:DNA repair protein RecO (recombination protein O)